MRQLIDELGILPLVRRQADTHIANPRESIAVKETENPPQNKPKDKLNKEELRLLVKILKAIGHSCEHQHIRIQDGITHYQFNDNTLIFDDVNKADQDRIIHLAPLSLMLKDPEQKRPTWEKLKCFKN